MYELFSRSNIETISELPTSISIVSKESELIRQAQTNHYWSTITEDKYDALIDRLSSLIKFIGVVEKKE